MRGLIVNRDEAARARLRVAFGAAGAEVVEAGTWQAAAPMLRDGPTVELLICEASTLAALGWPSIRRSRGPVDAPLVVIVTASRDELAEALAALVDGAFDVLPAPLDADACALAAWRACDDVRAACETTRMERELAERRARLAREIADLAAAAARQPAIERLAAERGELICASLADRLAGLPERLEATVIDDAVAGAAVADAAFAARQAQRMVHDLLDVDRAERAELPIAARLTELSGFLAELLGAVARIAADYDASVALECPSDPGACHTDPDLLGRALHNLLDTALRRGRRGIVSLLVETTDAEVCFTVSDTSPPPPDRLLGSLFERRNRLESGTIQRAAGLAFCRAAVRALGGSLLARTPPTGGLSIRLSLPRHAEDLPGAERPRRVA